MRASALHPGDRVEFDRKGFVFTATVVSSTPRKYVRFKDPTPTVTWQFLPPRMAKRKVAG